MEGGNTHTHTFVAVFDFEHSFLMGGHRHKTHAGEGRQEGVGRRQGGDLSGQFTAQRRQRRLRTDAHKPQRRRPEKHRDVRFPRRHLPRRRKRVKIQAQTQTQTDSATLRVWHTARRHVNV